jgi:hypothetical protein
MVELLGRTYTYKNVNCSFFFRKDMPHFVFAYFYLSRNLGNYETSFLQYLSCPASLFS